MQVQKKESYVTQLGRQVWTEYSTSSVSAVQPFQITVFDTLQSSRGGCNPSVSTQVKTQARDPTSAVTPFAEYTVIEAYRKALERCHINLSVSHLHTDTLYKWILRIQQLLCSGYVF